MTPRVRRGRGWADTHAAWRRQHEAPSGSGQSAYADTSKIPEDDRDRTVEELPNGTILTTYLDRPTAPPPAVPQRSLVGVPGSGHEGSFDPSLPPLPAPPPAPKPRRKSRLPEHLRRFENDDSTHAP